MSVYRYRNLGNFVTLDFRKREDADICLNLDGTEFKSGFKMKILRVKRFIEEWNKEIDKGIMPGKNGAASKGTHFSEADKGSAVEEGKEPGEQSKD
jgi:hypothetical protein